MLDEIVETFNHIEYYGQVWKKQMELDSRKCQNKRYHYLSAKKNGNNGKQQNEQQDSSHTTEAIDHRKFFRRRTECICS